MDQGIRWFLLMEKPRGYKALASVTLKVPKHEIFDGGFFA
jgi:hypothetical protein